MAVVGAAILTVTVVQQHRERDARESQQEALERLRELEQNPPAPAPYVVGWTWEGLACADGWSLSASPED